MRKAPNDPKLSDGGAWRGACPTVERTDDAANGDEAPLAKSTRRDTRSCSMQRIVRRSSEDAEIKRWVENDGTPVVMTNGWKRTDNAMREKHPVTFWILSRLASLQRKLRLFLLRNEYV